MVTIHQVQPPEFTAACGNGKRCGLHTLTHQTHQKSQPLRELARFAHNKRARIAHFTMSTPMRIAVLDDDPAQLSYLVHALARQLEMGEETVSCCPFHKGEALRKSLRGGETYDLLVLDWNVPDLDGVELLNWLRSFQKSDVPVIMLSSRSSERDVANALGLGADDYVVKPFRTLELCARIRRLLSRKPSAVSTEADRFGNWKFDHPTLSVHFSAPAGTLQKIALTDREFRLALALFRHIGQPVSRAYLLETLGVPGEEMPSRALDSHVYRLRNKLNLHSASGLRLQTVYGRGYRLVRVELGDYEVETAEPPRHKEDAEQDISHLVRAKMAEAGGEEPGLKPRQGNPHDFKAEGIGKSPPDKNDELPGQSSEAA